MATTRKPTANTASHADTVQVSSQPVQVLATATSPTEDSKVPKNMLAMLNKLEQFFDGGDDGAGAGAGAEWIKNIKLAYTKPEVTNGKVLDSSGWHNKSDYADLGHCLATTLAASSNVEEKAA